MFTCLSWNAASDFSQFFFFQYYSVAVQGASVPMLLLRCSWENRTGALENRPFIVYFFSLVAWAVSLCLAAFRVALMYLYCTSYSSIHHASHWTILHLSKLTNIVPDFLDCGFKLSSLPIQIFDLTLMCFSDYCGNMSSLFHICKLCQCIGVVCLVWVATLSQRFICWKSLH